MEEIEAADLPQGGHYASVKVCCCRTGGETQQPAHRRLNCIWQILYPEGSSTLNHPGLACQVPFVSFCALAASCNDSALLWVSQSIMHKPGMSYVICTTASARLDMLNKGDIWSKLVEACKSTDLTHELPKSEFGDLDFGFDE